MTKAFPSRHLKTGILLLSLCVAAMLGLVPQQRGDGWFADLFVSARADARSPSGIGTRLPPSMPADLVAVSLQPTTNVAADPDEARRVNAQLPFSNSAIEAARPFYLASNLSDRERALQCMTQAIYYEAGFEPVEGRRAVAQVVLNRMRHPAYPNSVCGVIYQGSTAPGCQFSFTCDGALARPPARRAWEEAAAIAREALNGYVYSAVGQATHYHTDYVAPYWAPKLAKITRIGAHIFYRWPGNWGKRQAFTSGYAGEPAVNTASLAVAALDMQAAEGVPLPAGPQERRASNDVGGRLDPSKGWTLSIPLPMETKGALSGVLSTQEKPVETASATVTSQISGGR